MKSDNLPLSTLLAFAIGIAQMAVLQYFWTGMVYVHHIEWLIAHGVHGGWLRALLFVFDNIVNLALCLPAAFALRALRPRKLWIYLLVAVLPGFLWNFRPLLTETAWLSHWTGFVPGVVMELLTLPLAVLIAGLWATRRVS